MLRRATQRIYAQRLFQFGNQRQRSIHPCNYPSQSPQRLNLWLFLAGFVTFALHETAHFAVGWALGHDMSVRLNGGSSSTPVLLMHKAIIDAAGPLATIAQAIVTFIFASAL
jgi:hypothetical protein